MEDKGELYFVGLYFVYEGRKWDSRLRLLEKYDVY